LRKTKKILIIIQRSNGDVFLSLSLVKALNEYYESPHIDLLVNDDTFAIAKLIPFIKNIHTFSYQEKKNNRWKQEKNIIVKIFRKYDLSINLTASDRSVIYGLIAGSNSISAVEKDIRKSWWKKIFLSHYYYFDPYKHILLNNLQPLRILKIKYDNLQQSINFSSSNYYDIKSKLKLDGISKFVIFHPSAQYNYKIYPKKLRDILLKFLNTLEIPIVITGGNTEIDLNIKKEIPSLSNIYNYIGETSLKDYFMLSDLALAYIGMDTLNMHIASSQNKRIFAIFGPTRLSMWSPWSNNLKTSASINKPIQTYGKNTIFQANMKCIECIKAGCNGSDKCECLININPEIVFEEVSNWYKNAVV
jgi:heptosyltransferase-3